MPRLLFACSLLCLGAACSPSPSTSCSSAPTPLADCYVGDFYADCGGSGPARLGCLPDAAGGGCKWFTGGCAADGYVLSDCDATDACCHPSVVGTTATWPYAGGVLERSAWWFGMAGHAAWDRDRERIMPTVLDGSLASQPITVTCTGDEPFSSDQSPCHSPRLLATVTGTDTVVITLAGNDTHGYTSWGVELEVAAAADGTLSTRACTYTTSDGGYPACRAGDDPICATSGTVRLAAFSPGATSVAADIDLTLSTGLRIQARF